MNDLPTYHCRRISVPPSLDGSLTDSMWQIAEPTSPFIVADGSHPAERQTTARAVWDDRCLYVAFECVDPDVWGTYTKRGDPVYQEEVVEVFITPHPTDLRVHTALELSPRNVLWISRHTLTPGQAPTAERNWDAPGIRTRTHVRGTLDDRTDRDEGWSAELAIAYSELGASCPQPGDVWRINFFRIDRTPTPEFSSWSPTLTTPPAFHVPERFGLLRFEPEVDAPDCSFITVSQPA